MSAVNDYMEAIAPADSASALVRGTAMHAISFDADGTIDRQRFENEVRGLAATLPSARYAVNLCEGCHDLVAPMPLYSLRIGMEIDRREEFLELIARRVGR